MYRTECGWRSWIIGGISQSTWWVETHTNAKGENQINAKEKKSCCHFYSMWNGINSCFSCFLSLLIFGVTTVKPFLIRGPQNQTAVVGSSVTFQCRVGGEPGKFNSILFILMVLCLSLFYIYLTKHLFCYSSTRRSMAPFGKRWKYAFTWVYCLYIFRLGLSKNTFVFWAHKHWELYLQFRCFE